MPSLKEIPDLPKIEDLDYTIFQEEQKMYSLVQEGCNKIEKTRFLGLDWSSDEEVAPYPEFSFVDCVPIKEGFVQHITPPKYGTYEGGNNKYILPPHVLDNNEGRLIINNGIDECTEISREAERTAERTSVQLRNIYFRQDRLCSLSTIEERNSTYETIRIIKGIILAEQTEPVRLSDEDEKIAYELFRINSKKKSLKIDYENYKNGKTLTTELKEFAKKELYRLLDSTKQKIEQANGQEREEKFLTPEMVDEIVEAIFHFCSLLNIDIIDFIVTFNERISPNDLILIPDREIESSGSTYSKDKYANILIYGDTPTKQLPTLIHEMFHRMYPNENITSTYEEGITDLLALLATSNSPKLEETLVYPESILITLASGVMERMKSEKTIKDVKYFSSLKYDPDNIREYVGKNHKIPYDLKNTGQKIFQYPETDCDVLDCTSQEKRSILDLKKAIGKKNWEKFKAKLIKEFLTGYDLTPVQQKRIRDHLTSLWKNL